MTESDIKRSIVQYLRFVGALCWVNLSTGIWDPKIGKFRKMNGFGARKGVSDVLGIYRNKFFAIEVKRPGGRATTDQLFFIEDVIKHGGIAFVASSIDDVDKHLIDAMINQGKI